jgi:hypothetical protein
MPQVRGQHFPYTKKGKAQAKAARAKGKAAGPAGPSRPGMQRKGGVEALPPAKPGQGMKSLRPIPGAPVRKREAKPPMRLL